MKLRQWGAAVAIVAASSLMITGCGSSDDGGSSNASSIVDKASKDKKLTIGVKFDQPGLGLKNADGSFSGFDIDVAKYIAQQLGVQESGITFKETPSASRETALKNKEVDMIVATYSITDKRKADVDFAGPYFITGQGLLVRKDSGIDDVKDLSAFNGKTVCSATGSTPIQNIKANYPEIKTKEYDIYSGCVEDLLNGSVDAVTTDQAILIGYAAQHPDKLKIVGGLFTEERYGVGLTKGDTVLKDHINKLFTDGHDIWQKIFDKNLGKSGITVEQPKVD